MGRMFKLVKIVKSQSELSTEDYVNNAVGRTWEGNRKLRNLCHCIRRATALTIS